MTRFTFPQLAAAAALLAVFPVSAIRAQQATSQDKTENVAVAPAQANTASAPAHVSATGAPTLGFGAPAAVTNGPTVSPAMPAVQAPGPRVDPITYAPISSFGSGPTEATEVFADKVKNGDGAPASDGSVHQGLQVHGHWVINIRNPDGTLVQHHEFENSLTNAGQGYLVGLLSGYMVPGDWMIVLGNSSGTAPCTAFSQFCGMIHNAATYPAQAFCASLYYCTGSTLNYAYNFGTGFAGPYSIVLTGSITANQTGSIVQVYSLINLCANNADNGSNPNGIETSSPAACVAQTNPATWYGPLTTTNITPIAVTDGQLIQAIVTITFS